MRGSSRCYSFCLIDNFKLLLRLFAQPAAAMSDILDRGSLLFGICAVVAVSFMLQAPLGHVFNLFTPLLILAAVYVPGTLLLSKLLDRKSSGAGAAFQRDYAPLLTCTAMAWSAANLPLAATARILSVTIFLYLAAIVYLFFLVLMFFAIRTVFGTENGIALTVVCLSWLPLLAAFWLWGPFQYLLGWLASPFILLYAFYYFRNAGTELGAGFRNRQNFRRSLDAAALNPHDGEAQYQLGLVYQQRRQISQAIQRFESAVAIDPTLTDAHFQLGCIARRQGRPKDALTHFQTVLDQDEKHHQSEILRELGALYLAARQFEDARGELARYIERRPYDPEGLYYMGECLKTLGQTAEAREMYRRSIEAARAAPPYLQRAAAKWSRLAQSQL
jgi:tetratricopeptide (TPR) repeat protein